MELKTKEEIEDAYISEMLKGCVCEKHTKGADKDVLDKLIKDYEQLGGTEGELITNMLQKQAQKNSVKISSGTLGYPTM